MKRSEVEVYRQAALTYLDRAGVVPRPEEKTGLEVADFGPGEFETTGLILYTYVNNTYVNTERACAKELVLPRQTCPQHLYPSVGGEAGKEETFCCRRGTVYLYAEGKPTPDPQAQPPAHRRETYTVRHEVILHPGEQYTLFPDTRHWFQGGEGVLISEFPIRSRDENDVFTDVRVRRLPVVEA